MPCQGGTNPRERLEILQLLHGIGTVQFRSISDLHGPPCPSHAHLRQRQLSLHRTSGPRSGHVGHNAWPGRDYCTYKGKWHLSNAYVDPVNPVSTADALEPYGFHEWNDWGDIDGGAWAGLRVDPVIAGQAAAWLRNRAASVAADQPWFMTVNFVNPHDVMSFDYGGRSSVQLPPNLAHAVVAKPPADIPMSRLGGTSRRRRTGVIAIQRRQRSRSTGR